MQTQLVLNDVRPRPRIYSNFVISEAQSAFLAENELSLMLPDFAASDEEWLREAFIKSLMGTDPNDAWAAAAEFAEEVHDTVCEDYVGLFDKFSAFLSKWQEQVIKDWVASGGIVSPLTAQVMRVTASGTSEEGEMTGIAFRVPSLAEKAQFHFLPDAVRSASISETGEITRLRILDWEAITTVEEATTDDMAVSDAHVAQVQIRRQLAEQRDRRVMAERQRDALLKENTVSKEEAQAIYASLGLTDEEAAARAVNAILHVLTQRQIDRLAD